MGVDLAGYPDGSVLTHPHTLIGNMHDDDWKDAEAALEKARKLPSGAERIQALKDAAKLRFAADR